MPKAEICKMKKTIALALSLCTLASSLMSCSSSDAGKYSPEITVSSSNAEDYAVWLTNRLGDKLTDSIYLALGSDASRGIDMTDFENDGYILRTEGGSVTVAGKTETGLDLAVRRYANAVEAGTASELDASYHEGYRIEKLMLAGHDISEYAIEYPAEHNENMLYAVSEMQRLIKKACGAELDAAQGISVRECAIEFRHSRDDSLRYDGYRYFFEGSRLVIEGAVERGCMWGVWFFLENELGWECINYGNSLLREADLIEDERRLRKDRRSVVRLFRSPRNVRYEDGHGALQSPEVNRFEIFLRRDLIRMPRNPDEKMGRLQHGRLSALLHRRGCVLQCKG